jgi:hypothetical protein
METCLFAEVLLSNGYSTGTYLAVATQQLVNIPQYTRCSLCRLIRRPGSFRETLIGRHCGSPRQTQGHSFGEHLISESVSVAPSGVTEASFYSAVFCVFIVGVRYNLEQRVFIYDCYVKTKSQIVQEKISPSFSQHNMSIWRYNSQISEEKFEPTAF